MKTFRISLFAISAALWLLPTMAQANNQLLNRQIKELTDYVSALEVKIADRKALGTRLSELRQEQEDLAKTRNGLAASLELLQEEQQGLEQQVAAHQAPKEMHWDRVELTSGKTIGCRVSTLTRNKAVLVSEDGERKEGALTAIKQITFQDPAVEPTAFPRKKAPPPRPKPKAAKVDNRPFLLELSVRLPTGGSHDKEGEDYDNKKQVVRYNIKVQSREGRRILGDAKAVIYGIGKGVVDKDEFKMLLRQEFDLTVAPGKTVELLTKSVDNVYDNHRTAKFGHKTYGYALLIYDKNEKLIMTKTNSSFMERNIPKFENVGEGEKFQL